MAFIAVLEDDPRRVTAMRAAARSRLADYDVRIFNRVDGVPQWALRRKNHQLGLGK